MQCSKSLQTLHVAKWLYISNRLRDGLVEKMKHIGMSLGVIDVSQFFTPPPVTDHDVIYGRPLTQVQNLIE